MGKADLAAYILLQIDLLLLQESIAVNPSSRKGGIDHGCSVEYLCFALDPLGRSLCITAAAGFKANNHSLCRYMYSSTIIIFQLDKLKQQVQRSN